MAIVELLATGDARAADSLLVLRIEVLAENQALAAALADVLQALDEGRDLTTALIRARRTIMDPPVHSALGAWGWVP